MLATLVLIGLTADSPAQDSSSAGRRDRRLRGGRLRRLEGRRPGVRRPPGRGTLPGQMAVSGYLGRGLVNSFNGGDDATGTLTSPPFRIDRPFLNFLIGGGGFEGETCVNLIVDGKAVRTATGKNRDAGGTEALKWDGWDVGDLDGKEAVVQIVDRRKGGWGHINIDQIVQSDASRKPAEAVRSVVVDHATCILPVRTGGPKTRMKFVIDGGTVREFDIELAEGKPDFWVFSDMGSVQGPEPQDPRRRAGRPQGARRDRRRPTNVPDAAGMYKEKHRPQFHFTSRRGWLNDPNGLVWQDGEYHHVLPAQPVRLELGEHALGPRRQPRPRPLDRAADRDLSPRIRRLGLLRQRGRRHRGTPAAFRAGSEAPMVAAYTSTGRGECIVYSNDRGRTWTEYPGNPVVKHNGRDPRLLWHAPSKHWVMAVYDEGEKRRSIDFYTSPDMKTWTFASRIDGFFECPDLFELPVDGDPDKTLWVALRGRRQVQARPVRRQDVPRRVRAREAHALARELLRGADVQQRARTAVASRSAGGGGSRSPACRSTSRCRCRST